MRNFRRSVWFSWPYKGQLATSVVCALVVAVLWSVNLSAFFPVLNLLSSDRNLQEWVDDEIASRSAQRDRQNEILAGQNRELQRIEKEPDTPEREKYQRRLAAAVAATTDEQNEHADAAYRYQWLRAKVIRHMPTDKFETFLWIVGALLTCVLVKGVFEFFNESLVGRVTNRTLFDLRNAFFRRVIRQDVRQLAGGTTDLMSRFTTDTEQIGGGLKVLYGRVIAEPLKAAACFVAACLICWQLTLLFVVVVPLALYVLMRVSKAMRKAARRALERMSAMYKILRETLDGVRAVKGFTREAHERRRFRAANREFYRKAMRLVNLDAFTNPALEVLIVAAVGLALLAGAYLVLTKSTQIWRIPMCAQPLSFATLLQLYVFLAAIADPVRKLSSVYAKLQNAEAASARVFEVYDREPRVEGNRNGPRPTGVVKRIEFRHVCFSYNPAADQPTLDNVSFTVKADETIAVVGGNGCGKTTLLALLPRFFDPDSGAVLVDGVNIRTAHLRSLRKLIGVVTQDTQLFDDSVFANIAYGKRGATREEVIAAAKKARAHECIERKPEGYDALVGEGGANFSGGEKQKIALARAILRNPSLLILDEFTSQIDQQSEADIHAAIKEFVKGRTTFLITHKLNTVPEIADRVAMMESGKLLDIGTHAELLARCEPYRRLFESGQSWKTEPATAEAPALSGENSKPVPPAPNPSARVNSAPANQVGQVEAPVGSSSTAHAKGTHAPLGPGAVVGVPASQNAETAAPPPATPGKEPDKSAPPALPSVVQVPANQHTEAATPPPAPELKLPTRPAPPTQRDAA